MCEDEKTDQELLCAAMFAAREAFFKYFEDDGTDAAYFDLDLIGRELSLEFEPLFEIKMGLPKNEDKNQ